MATTNLLFDLAPNSTGNLLFGETATPVVAPIGATIGATLPSLTLAALAVPNASATLNAALPRLTVGATAICLSGGATINANLPGLTFAALAISNANATLSATFPGLEFSATIAGAAIDATLDATLPGLTLAALVVPNTDATLNDSFPSLTFTAAARYNSYAHRPTVGATTTEWQPANQQLAGVSAAVTPSVRTPAGAESAWSPADKAQTQSRSDSRSATRVNSAAATARHENACRAGASRSFSHQDTDHGIRVSTRAGFEAGTRRGNSRSALHQDGYRDRRLDRRSIFQDATPRARGYAWGMLPGFDLRTPFATGQQNAQKPPAGLSSWVIVVPPGENLCYTPSGQLVFKAPFGASGDLTFVCDNYIKPVTPPVGRIVVPVRKVYMQVNSQSLTLASTGQVIETAGLSLSLDVDSWVWGWSATVKAAYLPLLQAVQGDAIELIATLNGTAFNLFVERVSRERKFGESRLSISGRGRAAWLDAPYASIKTRYNTDAMTAQQIMVDALSINGVSGAWSLDWQITDWLVPSGAWSHTGTPMAACLAVAEAAGAYIQADRTANILHVLPRYVTPRWQWAALTPDIELPEDVCVTEGIEWRDSPNYNAIYVSGETGGILTQVKRTGTDGGNPAPMVVNPLITHADAARQRGTKELSNTGRSKVITLQIPLLAETGIIAPGKIIKYTESGQDHIGVCRSVQVTSDFPKIRQSIAVETHVL